MSLVSDTGAHACLANGSADDVAVAAPATPPATKRFRAFFETPEKLERPGKRIRAQHSDTRIIGLAGPMGAGKGTVADCLVKRGYVHHRVRDHLESLVQERGLEPNRTTMLEVANELRDLEGPAVLIEDMCRRAKAQRGLHIVDSVRTIAEARALNTAGGLLLYVDAEQSTRYERVVARGSCTDNISLAKFGNQDAQEARSLDPCRPSLLDVRDLALHEVKNVAGFPELRSILDKIFGQAPPWVCILGPHGTGKTFLLNRVSARLNKVGFKFHSCEELARPLIQEMGLEQRDFNEFNDAVVGFQWRLFDKYFDHHRAAKTNALLSDRCALDQLAYMDWQAKRGKVPNETVEKMWRHATERGLKSLYASTTFILMQPEEGLCKNDGTRMQSSLAEVWELYAAFQRVLDRAGFSYRPFSSLKDDAGDIYQCFLAS